VYLAWMGDGVQPGHHGEKWEVLGDNHGDGGAGNGRKKHSEGITVRPWGEGARPVVDTEGTRREVSQCGRLAWRWTRRSSDDESKAAGFGIMVVGWVELGRLRTRRCWT